MDFTAALAGAGLLVSILSALENRVPWIAAFCTFFGDGCRRTQDFRLLRVPVSWWGIAYYAVLAAAVTAAEPWVFWLVAAGAGFELTFLRIMGALRVFCIFCLFNAAVVIGLAAAVFDPARVWEGTTLALAVFIGSRILLEGQNREKMADVPQARAEDALAVVDGEPITREAVEQPLAQQIYRLERRIYRLKRERLEDLIRERLLAKEAARRGTSKERLVADILREASSGAAGRSEDGDCRDGACPLPAFGGSRAEPAPQETASAPPEEKEAVVRRFTEELKTDFAVQVRLPKPLLPRARVPIEGRPCQGPEDAAVVVVAFSDPVCPACRKAHQAARNVRAAYADRVRWVYMDFPLENHPGAKTAAAAAHCAGEQGQFWEYQDLLFQAEEGIDAEALKRMAASLDLDEDAFEECLGEGRYRDQIEKDRSAGRAVGVSATPTFIIDGEMIAGVLSEAEFKEKIEAALATRKGTRAAGRAGDRRTLQDERATA